ncbi:YheT family hydrolase [Ulvibacter litoralis]|uniref:AB hydrolase-1 domain-containing protein n=1 Tax=Ulvibacter litoralis TaxID=227084 RepID=A0A1G7DHN4_9FLAO|nr:alpha/beta fold hydrolase [Ulvibacter litoralis]GHC43396.1 alpha/beta hydrolase [Ulvibacter litoralis]SDE51037.1 hypothetical protein SAMN05421855_101989 [Ulvibacter litoralis]
MPLVKSNFQPKLPFKNGHFSTIYSAKLRPDLKLVQKRERLQLPDQDFIDVDWSFSEEKTEKVAILLHGLEGNAQRRYIKGQAKLLIENGWDVVAMNHRGCSGEDNLLFSSYNSGDTSDLAFVVEYLLKKSKYQHIHLIGFSLGGNLVLKYLGEQKNLPKQVKKGVAISTPINLRGSLEALEKRRNLVYSTTFILDLRKKYKRKMARFPKRMTPKTYRKITSLFKFDNLYTAPAGGFKDAYDYYEKSSSLPYLKHITVPVLILNALNDSFLSPDCYPYKIASESEHVFLETPKYGGHVGFHINNHLYYSEQRTLAFLKDE